MYEGLHGLYTSTCRFLVFLRLDIDHLTPHLMPSYLFVVDVMGSGHPVYDDLECYRCLIKIIDYVMSVDFYLSLVFRVELI